MKFKKTRRFLNQLNPVQKHACETSKMYSTNTEFDCPTCGKHLIDHPMVRSETNHHFEDLLHHLLSAEGQER